MVGRPLSGLTTKPNKEVSVADKKVSLPLQLVKKSNALCRARWNPKNVIEPRLVALLASKINHDDKNFKVYEIHVSEVIGDRHSGRDYLDIEQTIDNIMTRVITIYDDQGWTKYNVFSRCRFRRNEGILELGFHPDLTPHYLQLKKNFAKYRLAEFFMLPSTYSQRMYEILRSWDDKPDVEIDLPNLHKILDVPKSLKANFKDFRRRVLEKAYKDITTYTNLTYEWKPIKKGRKVSAIRFVFTKNKTQKLVKEKQRKAQKTNSQRNNKLGIAAVKCFEIRGNVCSKENPKTKKVCEVCKIINK